MVMMIIRSVVHRHALNLSYVMRPMLAWWPSDVDRSLAAFPRYRTFYFYVQFLHFSSYLHWISFFPNSVCFLSRFFLSILHYQDEISKLLDFLSFLSIFKLYQTVLEDHHQKKGSGNSDADDGRWFYFKPITEGSSFCVSLWLCERITLQLHLCTVTFPRSCALFYSNPMNGINRLNASRYEPSLFY